MCGIAYCANGQNSLQPQHTNETVFGPESEFASLPFPSGVYYSFDVTLTTPDSTYNYTKDPDETINEQAVAAIIVPCIHNDQFYIRFRDTIEYLKVEYIGLLMNQNGDFHTWVYESDHYGAGVITISIAGGAISMNAGDGCKYSFNYLITPIK